MHSYLGLLILAFLVTFAVMVPYIGLLYKLKFTRKKETGEVRKTATKAFYKIREMHAGKAGVATGGGRAGGGGVGGASILHWGLKIDFVYIPYWGPVFLGIGYFFLAALVIVAFANAFDFTDGLDGLSCGLLMICLMAFWLIFMAR